MRKTAFLIVLTFFLISTPPAHASVLDDLYNKTKEFLGFKPQPPEPVINLESSIGLAPNGDLDKNNQIDAGDTVTFYYKIANLTTEELKFATLKTNINKNDLHFIHNIKGTPNLSDHNGTVTIPNLKVSPGQTLDISFNAKINYFETGEKTISTEPELLNSSNQSLKKDSRKELKAKLGKNPFSNVKVTTKGQQ